jgi:hypothetical protein
VNEIRLSGKLEGIVEHHSGDNSFLTATLQFSRDGGILLVEAGPKVRQLQDFRTGDSVRVVGRLVLYKDAFGILLDECVRWTIANHSNKKFRYHDPSQAQKTIRELEA